MVTKKTIASFIVIIITVGGVAFYVGMKYAGRNNFPRQMGNRGQGFGSRSGGFVAGDIISKNDKSITIKLRDGGSKIVFYSDSTEVGKFVNGLISDLEIGKVATVSGQTNQDGSVTAQSIQIRDNVQGR